MTTNRRPRVEPSADKRAASRELYELFAALVDAGFTEHQALTVVGDAVRGVIDATGPTTRDPA